MGRIPQIADIVDFNVDPESYGELPPEIRGTDLKLNFTFQHFLDGLGGSGLELWEISAGRVIGTSDIGGKIFMDLGKILISFYRKGQFCGDILNRVRITENYCVHYPYPTVEATNSDALANGIKIDIQHFRRMVAKFIQVSFRNYPYIEFSNTVKLFFSEIFYKYTDYHVLPLLHPLFYSSIERLNFILLVDEYMKEYLYSEVGLADFSNPEYGFVNWWTHIPPTSICQDILHFENNFHTMYYQCPCNLILFIRNCHNHLIRKKKATHLEADSMLQQLFPDVCAVAIDSIARDPNMRDLISNKSQYTLMEYFFACTYGFNIIPYRYPGVHY